MLDRQLLARPRLAFACEGADVAFTFLPTEQSDADDVAQLVRQAGRKAVPLPGDLRDENFCDQLVADAVRELGGIDILVSNVARRQAAAAHSFFGIVSAARRRYPR